MTRRLARLLWAAAYGLACIWLAYCAVQSARNNAPWACAMFALLSAICVAAAEREAGLVDALRTAAHRVADALHPYDPADGLARVELAEACCELWWTSAGTDHDPTCPNREHRRTA